MPDHGGKSENAERKSRAQRLEAQLRANLKRRKEQARSRSRSGGGLEEAQPDGAPPQIEASED